MLPKIITKSVIYDALLSSFSNIFLRLVPTIVVKVVWIVVSLNFSSSLSYLDSLLYCFVYLFKTFF